MTRRFSSISTQTTLATSISNSALSLVVATGTASTLLGGVALTAGNVDQFKIIIDPDTASSEICYVTEVTSDTLTIARGKDGTSAVSHTGGAVIKHVLTGEDLTYFTTGVVPTSNLAVGLPFPGSTSGTNTLKAPAATGTVTNTLPATTGTLMSAESVDAATSKTTPVDADEIGLSDSAASFGLKKLTWANLKQAIGSFRKSGITYSAKTAAYTFAAGDEFQIFSMNNAASAQFNIPTDATYNFAVGTEFDVFWITGAGQPTIGAVTPATTTVISTGATSTTPKLRVANSGATVRKLAANSWIVFGDIA